MSDDLPLGAFLPAGIPFLNRQGEPIDLGTYEKLYPTDHQVADDTIGHIRISTIWCGYAVEPGHLFETMVFGGPLDREGHRSGTEEEALETHRLLLEVTTYAVEQGIWADTPSEQGEPCPPSTSTSTASPDGTTSPAITTGSYTPGPTGNSPPSQAR